MFFIIRTVASTGGQVGEKKKIHIWLDPGQGAVHKQIPRLCFFGFFFNGSVSKAANFQGVLSESLQRLSVRFGQNKLTSASCLGF